MIRKILNRTLKCRKTYQISKKPLRSFSFQPKSSEEILALNNEQFLEYTKEYHRFIFKKEFDTSKDFTFYKHSELTTLIRKFFASISLGIFGGSLLLMILHKIGASKTEEDHPEADFINAYNKQYFKTLEWLDKFQSGNFADRYRILCEEIPELYFWEEIENVRKKKREPFDELKERRMKEIKARHEENSVHDLDSGHGGMTFSSEFAESTSFKNSGDEDRIKVLEEKYDEVVELHYQVERAQNMVVVALLLGAFGIWGLRYGRMTKLRVNLGRRRAVMGFHFAVEKDQISDIDIGNLSVRYDPSLIHNGNYASSAGYEFCRKDGEKIIGMYKFLRQKAEYFDHEKMNYLIFLLDNNSRF